MQALQVPIQQDSVARHIIEAQVVGPSIMVSFDQVDEGTSTRPRPLAGAMHRQMAIGSSSSQIVIHQFLIEERRSPLMVPMSVVGHELLRQKLVPQAIDLYRRFLSEHKGTDEAVEAHFMLCLAFRQAGQFKQSERELEQFLSQAIDHPLAQDAIFELARLKVEAGPSVERAVRTVLSYQEADDRSRSRFCVWMIDHLCRQILHDGLSPDIERDLGLLQHLISVFEDSELLMDTLAFAMSGPIRIYGRAIMDDGHYELLDELHDAIQRCRLRGFDIQITDLHPLIWYQPIVKRLLELPKNHDDYVARVDRLLGQVRGFRDIMMLISVGGHEGIFRWLDSLERIPPPLLLMRAFLGCSLGREDLSQRDFMTCFQMMDVLETERSSTEVTVTARLAFFALDYLPWDVVWQPIERMVEGENYRALAALMAEHLGRYEASGSLSIALGQGHRPSCLAQAGLERVGDAESR